MSTTKKAPKKTNGNGGAEAKRVEHTLRVTNSGPIKDSGPLRFRAGWVPVLGANDTGKTRGLMQPVAILSGDEKAQFVLRRGASEGTIELDGTVYRFDRMTKGGDVEMTLISRSPLTGVIVPQFEDAKIAERHRLEDFLKLVRVPVDQENLYTLLESQNEDDDEDLAEKIDNAKELIDENLEALSIPSKNIVDAKEFLREQLNAWALKHEKDAAIAEGEAIAGAREKPARLSELEPADADAQYRQAVGDHRQLSGEWDQRQKREAERAEIRQNLGERPNLEDAEKASKTADDAHTRIVVELDDLRIELARLQERLANAEAREKEAGRVVTQALFHRNSVQVARDAWDRRKQILDSEITGATAEDVDTAARRVQEAADELEASRATKVYEEACVAVGIAEKARKDHAEAAKIYRKLSHGLTGALSAVLGDKVPGISVDDNGWLCATKDDGEVETFRDLNFSACVRKAFKAWASSRDLRGTIHGIPLWFYSELDPDNRAAMGREAEEIGVALVVAIPAEGELRIEQPGLSAEKAGEVAHA